MSNPVGGRMEAKAPIRVTDRSDQLRLAGLFLASLLLHVWLVSNSAMTARDSLGFAQLAVNLFKPNDGKPKLIPGDAASEAIPRTLPAVLREAKQPPGYPATIYATYFLLKRIDPPADPERISPHQLLLASQIAAAAAMVLAVFPMYWLGRMLLDKDRGFAAVLIFQFLPVAARATSDGLSEGLYFLGLSSALALGVAGIRKQSIGRSLLCGVAAGCTYLVRPEGLAVTIGALTVLLGLAALRWRPPANMLACAAAVLVGTGAAAAPYMMLIGGLTNKPSGKQVIDGTPAPGPVRPGFGAAANGPLFAEIQTDPDRGSGIEKAGTAGWTMAKEYLRASHYAIGVLGIVGLVLIRGKFRTHPEWLLLLATAGIQLTALARVAYSQSYASERHLLTAVFVAVYLAMAGLEPLFARFARFARWPSLGAFYRSPAALWVWVAVLVAICIPSLTSPLHKNRVEFREAGEFLAKEIRPEDRLTDPYEWSQYYAGRTLYLPPSADARFVEYAVLRNGGDGDDRRLNQGLVEQAKGVASQRLSTQVWPTDADGRPVGDAKVKVFRFDHRAVLGLGAIVGPAVHR